MNPFMKSSNVLYPLPYRKISRTDLLFLDYSTSIGSRSRSRKNAPRAKGSTSECLEHFRPHSSASVTVSGIRISKGCVHAHIKGVVTMVNYLVTRFDVAGRWMVD
jgi:hypothetical protein